MRKDAKIALIVILSLMVLVVVIWGRSPRPDDTLATPKAAPEDTRAADPEVIATAKSDTPDADAARHDAPGAAPADHSSSFPADTAMMNHVQPADAGRVRHVPDSAPRDSLAMGPADTQPDSAPADSAGAGNPAPGPTPARKPVVTHTVVKGDTLIGLAIQYYKDQGKWRLIQQANRGVSVLQIGQKLTIPALPDAPSKAAGGASPAPGAKPAPATPDKPAKPTPTPSRAKTYTVQKGDTFMKIARSVYRDPGKWRTLYERNRAKLPDPSKPNSLRPGIVIEVPALASSR